MITRDYSHNVISPEEYQDLNAIAGVQISEMTLEDHPNLLIFPDSFECYDRDFGKKVICHIENDVLYTNSIVGFVGRNSTNLSIHSRFSADKEKDYFLHYMLQKVAKINLFSLQHSMDEDTVFDFLLYLFPAYLKKALNQGVYRKYITKEYNDANIRGVVDVSRHIRQNIPFNGKVAYSSREFSYDNEVTQLIRHTIEFISRHAGGIDILNVDIETRQAVAEIINATPSFSLNDVGSVINSNLRPVIHPYYSEYTPLQRICLQVLRHEELNYGQEDNEIYGVLIDAAWLWEEYLAILLEKKYLHCRKESGKRFSLFENVFQQVIPDYLALDMSAVADAKYMHLEREGTYGEEKATAVYYKTITYMYRFCTDRGLLFYPHPDEPCTPKELKIGTERNGVNGGTITKLGLRIPSGCSSFEDFCTKMYTSEQEFLRRANV